MQLRRHARRVHRRNTAARLAPEARATAVADLSPGLRGHLAIAKLGGWTLRVSYLKDAGCVARSIN
jgi:hypothetical protein